MIKAICSYCMLQVPAARPFTKNCPSARRCYLCGQPGHIAADCHQGNYQGMSQRGAEASQELSATKSAGVVVAAVQPSAAVTRGVLDNKEVDMMLDSGSSVSLIEESVAANFSTETNTISSSLTLVSAAGKNIPTLVSITLPIQLETIQANHSRVTVHFLINPVILGLSFLHQYKIVVDFSSKPIQISTPDPSDLKLQNFLPLFDSTRKSKAKICAIEMLKEPTEEAIDDSAVSLFVNSLDNEYDMLPNVLYQHYYHYLNSTRVYFRHHWAAPP